MGNSRIRVWLLGSLLVMLLVTGCGGYPKMGPDAVNMAQALYSLCNQKRSDALPKAEAKIVELAADGAIQPHEAEYLSRVIALGKDGHWEKAMLECRAMMEDQLVEK